MTLVLLVCLVVVIGGVAAVALGRVRGGLPEPTTSRPPRPLPEVPLAAEDLDTVRFSLGLRGYRMDEVDAVLDRLRDEIAERDARLAALEAAVAEAPVAGVPAAETPVAQSPPVVPSRGPGRHTSDHRTAEQQHTHEQGSTSPRTEPGAAAPGRSEE